MESPPANGRVFWTAAVAVIGLDIVTKSLAARYLLPKHSPHNIVGDLVRFTLAYNPGAAFSMSLGSYSRYIFGAFAVIALVILWRLYRGAGPGEPSKALALGLAWGGAAGNLIDRIRSPDGVIDFIDIGAKGWRFWTFNVADSAVTIGAILLAWVLWQEDRQVGGAAPPGAPPLRAGSAGERDEASGGRDRP